MSPIIAESSAVERNALSKASPPGPVAVLHSVTAKSVDTLQELRAELQVLVSQGGPFPDEYGVFTRLIERVSLAIKSETISSGQWSGLLDSFEAPFGIDTVQGFARRQPHGYPGDFEVIERIYNKYVNPDPMLARWDEFLQAQAAPQAVRNRKAYFHSLLVNGKKSGGVLDVVNVGSGPGTDVQTFFEAHPDVHCQILSIDHDLKAITHARQLCSKHLARAEFIQKNALRFHTYRRFDVVWSAGLFDYLDDKLFVFLVRRLASLLKPGGQLVVGNFCDGNPTQAYMEVFGGWFLNYRSRAELAGLAVAAGFDPSSVSIQSEETGVNLFLHIQNQD